MMNEFFDDLMGSNPTQNQQNQVNQARSQQSHLDNLDQKILETLIDENRHLKQEMVQRTEQIEELEEKVDTLTQLEQEASEENEIMRFKVLSLEGQAAMEGEDLSQLKILDELRLGKKELQSEVDVLKSQVKTLKMLYSQLSKSDHANLEESTEQDDPKELLVQLKLLYDLNKAQLNQDDEIKIVVSQHLKETAVHHFYREKLFQGIAKKALEQAEFLFRARGSDTSLTGNGGASQSKIFVENKKLKKVNEQLEEKLKELTQRTERQETLSHEITHRQQAKIKALTGKIEMLQDCMADLSNEYLTLKSETRENLDLLKDYFPPNLEAILQRVQSFAQSHHKKIQEAHKAVFDKNKAISDLFNTNYQLQLQIQDLKGQAADNQQTSKLIYEKNKQISDLFNQANQSKNLYEQAQAQSERLKEDIKSFKNQLTQKETQHQKTVQELQEQNLKLDTEMKKIQKDQKLQQIVAQNSKEIEESRKAVYDKNKIINDYSNKLMDVEKKLKDAETELAKQRYDQQLRERLGVQQEQVAKEVEEARKAVYEKKKVISEMARKQTELEQKLQAYDQDQAKQKYDQMLREKLGVKQEEVSKEVEEARKAVYEKNKLISEMHKKQIELEEKLKSQEQDQTRSKYDQMLREKLGINEEKVSKEVEEARKAVYEKNKIINTMGNTQNELNQKIAQLEDQLRSYKDGGQVSSSQPKDRINPVQSTFGKQSQPEASSSDFLGGFFNSIQKQIFGQNEEAMSAPAQRSQPTTSQSNEILTQSKQSNAFEDMTKPESIPKTIKQEQTLPKQEDDFLQFLDQQASKQSKQQTSQSIPEKIVYGKEEKKKEQQPIIFGFTKKTDNEDQKKETNEEDDFFNFTSSFQPKKQDSFPLKVASQQDKDKNQVAQDKNDKQKTQVNLNSSIKKGSIEIKPQAPSGIANQPKLELDFLNFPVGQEAPKPSLAFLDDMFSGLLGATISKELETSNQQTSVAQIPLQAGWLEEEEIIMDEPIEEQKEDYSQITQKDQQTPQVNPINNLTEGWGDQQDIQLTEEHQNDLEFNDEIQEVQDQVQASTQIQIMQENTFISKNQEVDLGWGDNEEILIEEELQNEEQIEQESAQLQQEGGLRQEEDQEDQKQEIQPETVKQDSKKLDIDFGAAAWGEEGEEISFTADQEEQETTTAFIPPVYDNTQSLTQSNSLKFAVVDGWGEEDNMIDIEEEQAQESEINLEDLRPNQNLGNETLSQNNQKLVAMTEQTFNQKNNQEIEFQFDSNEDNVQQQVLNQGSTGEGWEAEEDIIIQEEEEKESSSQIREIQNQNVPATVYQGWNQSDIQITDEGDHQVTENDLQRYDPEENEPLIEVVQTNVAPLVSDQFRNRIGVSGWQQSDIIISDDLDQQPSYKNQDKQEIQEQKEQGRFEENQAQPTEGVFIYQELDEKEEKDIYDEALDSYQHLISAEERMRLNQMADIKLNTQMAGWLSQALGQVDILNNPQAEDFENEEEDEGQENYNDQQASATVSTEVLNFILHEQKMPVLQEDYFAQQIQNQNQEDDYQIYGEESVKEQSQNAPSMERKEYELPGQTQHSSQSKHSPLELIEEIKTGWGDDDILIEEDQEQEEGQEGTDVQKDQILTNQIPQFEAIQQQSLEENKEAQILDVLSLIEKFSPPKKQDFLESLIPSPQSKEELRTQQVEQTPPKDRGWSADEISINDEEEEKEELGEQEGGTEQTAVINIYENPHLSLLNNEPKPNLEGGWDDDDIIDI